MVAGATLNDRYVVDRYLLARGGMGEVWPARDQHLERVVVVKLLSFLDGKPDIDLVHRFMREAKLTARMNHPGVPAIYDLGVHDGRPFLIMQRVYGINVVDLIAEHHPLPISWAAAIGAQISSVLIAAHDIALIHRDIKPDNLILDASGAVKVLDFGLAAALGDDTLSRITRTGQSLGTPGYMAPEQVIGDPISNRTDLYGLGCTMFDLLTGQPPFSASTAYAVMNQHLTGPPPRLRKLRPEIPQELEDLVLAMLEKQPGDRPASASACYDALAALVGDLPPIPGVVTTETDAVRAYSSIIGRVPARTHATANPQHAPGPAVERADFDRVRREAADLLKAGRSDSAADLLEAMLDAAARTFGAADTDVVRLRTLYAEMLQGAGEFRAAARQYRVLASEQAEKHGPDSAQVFDCRLKAARAHVMLDERSRALTQLSELLRDQVRVNGSDHPAVQDLRHEIAALDADRPSRTSGH